MSDKPEAMTEAHTPTPWRRIAQGGSSTIVSSAKPQRNDTRIPGYGYKDNAHCIAYPFIEDDGRYRLDFVCFSHADADLIVLAVNSHARLLKEREELVRGLEAIQQRANETGGTDQMALINTVHAMHQLATATLLTLKE